MVRVGDEAPKKLSKRARSKLGFYEHLGPYLVVNGGFAALNWLTSSYPWFLWIAGLWGIGLAIHAYEVFIAEPIKYRLIARESTAVPSVAAEVSVTEDEPLLSTQEEQKIKTGSPEGTVTIMFTDIDDFTEYMAHGQELAFNLLQRHHQIIRSQVGRYGGTEVKSYGDGFMIAFPSTRQAIRCAVDIQRDLDSYNQAQPNPIRVRIGLDSGEPIRDQGDYIGRCVNLASRIMDEARSGQVLISETVKALAGDLSGIQYVDQGEHPLQGFPGVYRLYEVSPIAALAHPLDSEIETELKKIEERVRQQEPES